MKLGTKIFFYVIVCFSVIFLAGGYSLLSSFYVSAINREIDMASEQYQYNKFVMQAALITKGEKWFNKVVSGEYTLNSIANDMNNTVAFLTLEGEVLYSEFAPDTDFRDLISDMGEDAVNYQFFNINGGTSIVLAGKITENDTGVILIMGLDIENILEQQEQMTIKFGRIYAVAVGVGMVLVFGLSFWLTRPIKRLTRVTEKIADGNYEERIEEKGRDEVSQLAVNFNHMADAIEEKIMRLQNNAREKEDFVANFAHELKTPLTSVIGYADRIYQKELSREEQKKAAWYIWNEGMRLEALSHKLMELTLLNHQTFVLQRVRADQMLYELTEELEYMAQKRGVTLSCHAQRVVVRVEYDLFKSLLINLIDNAMKAGAKEIIILGKAVSEQKYRLKIQDDGCGIPEHEIKRITEAFYMVDKSRSRKLHGAGIGLALAEKIAQIHGTRLRFQSDGRTGTTVIFDLHRGGRRVE